MSSPLILQYSTVSLRYCLVNSGLWRQLLFLMMPDTPEYKNKKDKNKKPPPSRDRGGLAFGRTKPIQASNINTYIGQKIVMDCSGHLYFSLKVALPFNDILQIECGHRSFWWNDPCYITTTQYLVFGLVLPLYRVVVKKNLTFPRKTEKRYKITIDAYITKPLGAKGLKALVTHRFSLCIYTLKMAIYTST